MKYIPKTREELKELVQNENIYLGDIDISNIRDMSLVFFESKRKSYDGIEKWDVSNVEDMSSMFQLSNFDGDISKWNVSNVKYMDGMFMATQFNGDISKWDVSKVENMMDMFAYSKFNQDISKWSLNKAKNVDYMFDNCNIHEAYKPNQLQNIDNEREY